MVRTGALRLALLCAVAAGCSPAVWPRVISTAALDAPPTRHGAWIADYDTALASIAHVMGEDLGLPAGPVDLRFYRDRDAFRAALVADGYDGDLAIDAAATMTAITGHRRILINDAGLRGLDWPFRIALLAHELTHTVQYELGGGRRGTSEQWLREGFAEWVEVEVLAALGFTTRDDARRIARERAGRVVLPPLTEMVTFPDWVRIGLDAGTEPLYATALLAAGRLVERHGVPRVLAYFEMFAASDDRLANFERAFGTTLAAFQQEFREAP